MSRSFNNTQDTRVNSAVLKEKELGFATLAHDLKNPVRAQILSLKMLANGTLGKLNRKQKDMLDIILESANYLNEMLLSVLNSYKFDNGIICLTKKEFFLEELIQNCINEIQSVAKSKNLNIKFRAENPNLRVYADPVQLRRVIENLLNNSLKYSFKNSELIISILNDAEKTIFYIENNSPEIPQNIKEHIFEKYVSTTGSGLGLYFSKKIIEAHCGKMYLETNGTSNKFVFEIPSNNITKSD